jgi:hypothetical protein
MKSFAVKSKYRLTDTNSLLNKAHKTDILKQN